MKHGDWLAKTIEMAIDNVNRDGGPFAAIIVKDGKVIGSGTNIDHDPSAHAEMIAIREACANIQTTDLSDCILYASCEPCPMCLGAAYWSTVSHIYYACSKTDALSKAGFSNPLECYFSDQQKDASDRLVPFIHMQTDNALDPFLEWKRQHNV